MPEASDFLHKKIVVYFDDGQKIVRKVGILKEVGSNSITIEEGEEPQLIPFGRIIRLKLYDEVDEGATK